MRIRSIISSSVGNILEWYDFGLFAIYSPLFAKLFFPTNDPAVALITIFSVFAVGFLCRPLGALIFGVMGDRQGRVKTLRLSILMISIPTLLVGFLPTYATIGILAPILLVLIRLWQGISLGGEFSGNIIYLAETAPTQKRGFITSFAGTGANIGILLAAGVNFVTMSLMPSTLFEQWGWRIPYIVSGLVCILIYATRLQMKETQVFSYLKKKKMIAEHPIIWAFRDNWREMLRTMILVSMGSIFYYLCFVYMPTYLMQNLHFSLSYATGLMMFFIGLMIFLVPIAGFLNDKMGRRKTFLLTSILILLVAIPGFYLLLKNNFIVTLIVLSVFTMMSSLEQASTSIVVVENYPTPARYTGLSFSYNVGVALFGGTTPLICQWLIQKMHTPIMPAFYIGFFALITAGVAYFFVKETKGQSIL